MKLSSVFPQCGSRSLLTFSVINLLTSLLLLLLPLAKASPVSSDLGNPNYDEQDSIPYSCEWDEGMIPCEVNITTGRIVDPSTGTIIGYLNHTAGLNLEASPSTGSNSNSNQARAFGGERDDKNYLSSPPENQLEKRHDYALNCGDGNGYTYRTCSGAPFWYYCKSNGGLDNKGRNSNYCDTYCNCQEIFFKYCPTAANRLIKCLSSAVDLGDDASTSDNGTSNLQQREASKTPEGEVKQVDALSPRQI